MVLCDAICTLEPFPGFIMLQRLILIDLVWEMLVGINDYVYQ